MTTPKPVETPTLEAPVETTLTTSVPPVVEHTQGTPTSTGPGEQGAGAFAPGHTSEGSSKGPGSPPATIVTAPALPPAGSALAATPSASADVIAIGAGAPEVPSVLAEASAASRLAGSVRVAAAQSAAFGAGPLGCAAPGAGTSGACAGWTSAAHLLPPSSIALGGPTGAVSSASTKPGASDVPSRSVVSTPPVAPTPAPQPSGTASGAAAAGGGLALSGFLSFTVLLMLTAPRATRRLRLLCRPWRSSCFALIPERPG